MTEMRHQDGQTVSKLISGICICPAPMITEIERQKRLEEFRLCIWANGCIIEKEWRVYNPVFDKKGEKTTTKFLVRPAKDKSELEFTASKLKLVKS